MNEVDVKGMTLVEIANVTNKNDRVMLRIWTDVILYDTNRLPHTKETCYLSMLGKAHKERMWEDFKIFNVLDKLK